MKYINNTIVVIRSTNERTFSVCKELCINQFSGSLFVVEECPFEIALRKCYEIGINSNKKWMITVDADVLLLGNAIESLVLNAENMPKNYIQLEGRVYDKITGLYRQAGHRIYRNELLPLALTHIPSDGSQIRPEFYTLQQMGKLGYPSRRISAVVGLHDFEQNYLDLYRKAFVHAKKHPFFVSDLIERCAKFLHSDSDYLVILKGLWDGLTNENAISIDKRKFIDRGEKSLEYLGIREKAPLDTVVSFILGFEEYANKITAYNTPPDFVNCDDPNLKKYQNFAWIINAQHRIHQRGLFRGSLSTIGTLFKRIGEFLDNF